MMHDEPCLMRYSKQGYCIVVCDIGNIDDLAKSSAVDLSMEEFIVVSKFQR